MHPYRRRILKEQQEMDEKAIEAISQQDECKDSITGMHHWKTQTAADEDRSPFRHDWGLIIGTFCVDCRKIKQDTKQA